MESFQFTMLLCVQNNLYGAVILTDIAKFTTLREILGHGTHQKLIELAKHIHIFVREADTVV
ncbi:hypothetical protein NTGM5_300029 [Candidatus Nitrotoga sp. M5]|nr:hypothetical protein NTGM5_300029 [Candidatus Nitrotoga sp. M5]